MLWVVVRAVKSLVAFSARFRMSPQSIHWLILLLLIFLAGCGGDNKVRVSGTIMCDGKPLAAGEILMIDEAGSSPPVWATVQEGKFESRDVPGRKRVEIRATRAKPVDNKDPGAAGLREDYIPSRYNRESKYSIVILSDRDNEIRIDITTP